MDRRAHQIPAPPALRGTSSQITLTLVLAGSLLAACSKSTDPNLGPPGVAAGFRVVIQPPASVVARATIPTVVVQLIDGPGDPVATSGTPVSVAIGSGGGALTGTPTVFTDVNGQAPFSNLAIQGLVGPRTLRFTSGQLSPVSSSTVNLTPGPAAALAATTPNSQSGVVSQAVGIRPAVKAQDLDGNGVAGIGVSFQVTTGGGAGSGLTQLTAANGIATVGGWTLGATPGTNAMAATSTPVLTGSAVTFTATGSASASAFTIELQYLTPVTASQQIAFEAAKARWQQVITGDVGGVTFQSFPASNCDPSDPSLAGTQVSGPVNDLRILVNLRAYDGAGKVLGASSPCYLRPSGSRLPYIGYMFFDTADLTTLENLGKLDEVMLHEMGHILGFGTLWEPAPPLWSMNFIVPVAKPPAISSLGFNGANAVSAFVNSNGGSGSVVTVEDTSVAGTGRSHWKEANFKNEVMTGYISGTTNPLSASTIGSMQDLGYTVNLAAADPFNLATAGLRAPGPPEPAPLVLHGDVFLGPRYTIDPRTGQTIRIR